MTPERLAAIQARADAATEGPWANYGDLTHEVYPVRTDEDDEPDNIASVVPSIADAHFIANARTDVPALLAYARDLEARIRRVEAVHVREVLAVHESHGEEAWCPACRVHWPCPTSAALTATEGAA